MGKAASWAKHHMRENRENQFRPEQIELYKQLRVTRANSDIRMEYTVEYITEGGNPMIAILDIADLTRKHAFRLNGAIHNSNNQERKDDDQRYYLEQIGWKVIDSEQGN